MSSRTMLITGASAGIGAATAIKAAEAGYDVAINYRSDSAGAKAVADAVTAAGQRALIVQGDVADADAVAHMFSEVLGAWGKLDVLVNNAGIVAPAARIEDMDADRLALIFAVNVTGTITCAQHAIRHMAYRHGGEGGAIVNLSSVAAQLGAPNQYADYAAAKGAVDTLTLAMALENATDGIRVNAVRPGVIDTAIHGKGGEPDRAQTMGTSAVPMKRPGTAGEVADAILWLASDAASYVTGEIIKVSGGR